MLEWGGFPITGIVPLPERTYQLLGSNEYLTACIAGRSETVKRRFCDSLVLSQLAHFAAGP